MQHKSAALESCVVILSPITAVQRESRECYWKTPQVSGLIDDELRNEWNSHTGIFMTILVVVVWSLNINPMKTFKLFVSVFRPQPHIFGFCVMIFSEIPTTLLSFQFSVFSFWLLCVLLAGGLIVFAFSGWYSNWFWGPSRELQWDNEDDFEFITIFGAIKWAGEGWKNKIKKA